ncbi:hypothetical protein H5395_02870 [Paracoccus sp. MC1854]|uniref:hypothetical protein n=1 Tax=Paracoccus sp. MC1854 TaxID=2760306 RepID=UPI0016016A9F|nr:hypothetical protein [Paracoccus sp. MC1854]MBB1490496.1 hypothetical protein [Paracoccus sp. MC1854]
MASNSLNAVDEVCARLTRLIGVSAAAGLVASRDGLNWDEMAGEFGLATIGLDGAVAALAALVLILLALAQSFAVIVLIGEKIGPPVRRWGRLAKLLALPFLFAICLVMGIVITEVRELAMSMSP